MKINNYGDVLSKGLNKKLIAYETFGSYQGDYIVVLENEDKFEFYKGNYGSCSGCDWLEAEKDWRTEEISDEKIKEYLKDFNPFLIVPKDTMNNLSLEAFIEILPANTRADIYDFEPEVLYKSIKNNENI